MGGAGGGGSSGVFVAVASMGHARSYRSRIEVAMKFKNARAIC